MIVVKDPIKISERKTGGFWLTVSEASAFTPKEKGNMATSKTMCLRKAAYFMASRRQKETEMGTPTSFLQ